MGADFPIPRAQLPRVSVSGNEIDALKLQMEQVLLHALDELAQFHEVDRRRVDAARWKQIAAREQLRLFQERQPERSLYNGSGPTSTSTATAFADDYASEYSYQPRRSVDSTDVFSASSTHTPKQYGSSKAAPKPVLLVGDVAGRMDNAVFALLTKSQDELALVNVFLHEDVADCAILALLQGPTNEEPYQFLGYKWLAKKAAAAGRFGKHRDVVYAEYCGITKTRGGEEIGFWIMESVDLPGFPEFPDRNCVRERQSIRFLFRQKQDHVVEVFATGTLRGASGHKRSGASIMTEDALFGVTRLMELAEVKRLTKMIITHRRSRENQVYTRRDKITECSLCHQQKKFYNTVSLHDCNVCGHSICSRCRAHKRVFISDGLLGRFHRVGCCKTCVLAADRSRMLVVNEPLKVSIAAQMMRQNSTRDFTAGGFNTRQQRASSDSSLITAEMAELAIQAGGVPTPTGSIRSGSSRSESKDGRRQAADPAMTPRGARGVTTTPTARTMALARQRSGSTATSTSSTLSGGSAQIAHYPYNATGGIVPSGQQLGYPRQPAPQAPPSSTAGTTPYSNLPRPQRDMMARMMELREIAESTYNSARQNDWQAHLPPHLRYQHQQQPQQRSHQQQQQPQQSSPYPPQQPVQYPPQQPQYRPQERPRREIYQPQYQSSPTPPPYPQQPMQQHAGQAQFYDHAGHSQGVRRR